MKRRWHAECARTLVDGMARLRVDVTASTEPPLITTAFTSMFVCPHGVRWFVEPTAAQRLAWAEEGAS